MVKNASHFSCCYANDRSNIQGLWVSNKTDLQLTIHPLISNIFPLLYVIDNKSFIFFRADKSNQKKPPKAPTLSLQQQKQRQREKANVAKRLKEYQRQPSTLLIGTDHSSPHSFTPTLEGKPIATPITILKSSKAEDTRNAERMERTRERKTSQSLDAGQPLKKSQSNNSLSPEGGLSRSISGSSMTSSSAEKRKRRPSDGDQPTKKRRDSEKSSIHRQISKQFDQNEGDFDPTPLRKNVTKGLKLSLIHI